jgi:glycosyltransferase involved in cell wall biosynthesis
VSLPAVTVLVDTYNHERFLEAALVSVLEQDVDPDDREIVVVDDGSTDGTPELVRKFAPWVRYVRKANGGQASAFNTGIAEAQGQVIAFLDGDDWWAPRKLHTVLEALEREPDVGAVGHGIVEAYGPGQHRELLPAADLRLHLRSLDGACRFRTSKAFLGTSRFAARKDVLQQVLPLPEALVFEADEFLFTTVAAVADVLVLRQSLTYYRLHANNLFQFHAHDEAKTRQKQRVLEGLVRTLPRTLRRLGAPAEAIAAVIEPIWVDAERLRLSLDGGMPWETYQVEKAAFRLACRHASPGYRVLKSAFLALGLVLPPRQFFRLRQWYAAKGLRKLRELLGKGEPTVSVAARWL